MKYTISIGFLFLAFLKTNAQTYKFDFGPGKLQQGYRQVLPQTTYSPEQGYGKGQVKRFHTFRPWPNAFLVQLTNADGKPLDVAARAAYQNPGY